MKVKLFEKFDEITPEDLEKACPMTSDEEESDTSDMDDHLSFFDTKNMDIDPDDLQEVGASSKCNVKDVGMDKDEYWKLCSQLNKEQRFLFNFIMRHTQERLHNERNDLNPPEPFFIFLSGGGGVGKTHTVKGIIEYFRRHLKFKDQNIDEQPSYLVCASCGTAAVRISGNTLHSTFKIPRNQSTLPLSSRNKDNLQKKCYFLHVIQDEVSMTGSSTWKTFEGRLRDGKKVCTKDAIQHPFGDVSVLAVGDFFQLPPVKQGYVFDMNNEESLDAFLPHPWKSYFYLHELTEIVRQQSDPTFAEVMSRVRVGKHTQEDIVVLKNMSCKCCKKNCGFQCKCECICVSDWPCVPIYLYMTNRLADLHNKRMIESLGSEIYTIYAKDSARDVATDRCENLVLDKDLDINQTGNLRGVLKVCKGTRVMVTVNIDLNDGIANGALGTIIEFRGNKNNMLKGEIYVQFDYPEVGRSRKIRKGKLEGSVPITPIVQTFTYNKRSKSECLISRKQYPLSAAHAITIHKSQSATYKYMLVDFNRETRSEDYKMSFNPGQQYTAFSRGEDRSRIIVKNFDPSLPINVNKKALKEMERLDKKRLKDKWCHPLENTGAFVISVLNIVSWNRHIEHFLSDSIHQSALDICCFTETHNAQRVTIEELTNGTWSSILKNTSHGLAICFKNKTVILEKEIETLGKIEMLAAHVKCGGIEVIISVVYRPASIPGGSFMEDLVHEIQAQPANIRKIIVGDFNLDQLLKANEDMVNRYAQQMSMIQKVAYSTHIYGGILDLVMDSEPTGSVDWMPTPFSDHFIVYHDVQ